MSDAAGRDSQSLFRLLETRARAHPSHVATRTLRAGAWEWTTWEDFHGAASAVAVALIARGVRVGDRVALFASSREEWVVSDFGILGAGAVTVPVYPTATPEQTAHVLRSSTANTAIVEGAAQLEAVAGALSVPVPGLPELREIVVIDSAVTRRAVSRSTGESVPVTAYVDLVREGRQAIERHDGNTVLHGRLDALAPSALATIVYTSGTTGPPRGATLTHAALLAEVRGLLHAIPLTEHDEQLLMLPLAHILARILVLTQVASGSKLAFASDPHRVMEDIAQIEPTLFAAVPRFFEKTYGSMTESATTQGPLKAALWSWAIDVGTETARARSRGKKVRGLDAARSRYADRLVLRRVRRAFGKRLRFAISGGAPLARELAEWFDGCGILVLEGYGLTEVCGASHVNRERAHRFGTVGQPVGEAEARTAEDGEVLLRGPSLMTGYWNDPDATRTAIDAEGWFHTGDIGKIDADGYLTVLDRKKDVIVTAGGSNVAPQNIERMLNASPWIDRAVVLGDARPYLVALIALDLPVCEAWARERRRPDSLEALAKDPELVALVQLDVDAVNRRLSSYETIKRFAILDRELGIRTGELTETGKVRRGAVRDRFSALVESLY